MKVYRVKFSTDAKKGIKRLPEKIRDRVLVTIQELEMNPRPHNVKKLVGSKSWRVRVGDYRIVYEIHEREIFVMVIRVAHRKDVYR